VPDARLARRRQREILDDARAECRHVLVLRTRQAVTGEPRRRLFAGARARESQHGSMFEPQVLGKLLEASFGEVDRVEQLTATLGRPDLLAPPGEVGR